MSIPTLPKSSQSLPSVRTPASFPWACSGIHSFNTNSCLPFRCQAKSYMGGPKTGKIGSLLLQGLQSSWRNRHMKMHSNVKQRENSKHSRVMTHKVRSSYKAGRWSYGGNSQCELGRSREGTEKRLPGKGGKGEGGACPALRREGGLSVHQAIKGKGERSIQQPEQSATSHRAMSHPEVSVQPQAVCEPGARKGGVRRGRRGLEPQHKGPCLPGYSHPSPGRQREAAGQPDAKEQHEA